MTDTDPTTPSTPPAHVILRAIAEGRDSPCGKSKRGVVIYDPHTTNSIVRGRNAPALGVCGNDDVCRAACARICIHAEQDSLLRGFDVVGADLVHVKVIDGVLVPSGGPSCVECSKLILAAGVDGVWLYHAEGWRRYSAEEFHRLTLAALGLPLTLARGLGTTEP